MSLKGTVILYTDLVFAFTRASFVIIDDHGQWGLIIENQGKDSQPIGSLTKLDWDLREWEECGWEIVRP